jgi:elongation factor 1-beta
MAKVITTLKIMPIDPEQDLKKIEEEATKFVNQFNGEVGRVEIEPIAFGLKAVKLILIHEESNGGTEPLEENINTIQGVNSVEVVDCRRALG